MGKGYRHARLQGDLLSAYCFIHLSRGNKNKDSKAYACLEEVKHFEWIGIEKTNKTKNQEENPIEIPEDGTELLCADFRCFYKTQGYQVDNTHANEHYKKDYKPIEHILNLKKRM